MINFNDYVELFERVDIHEMGNNLCVYINDNNAC